MSEEIIENEESTPAMSEREILESQLSDLRSQLTSHVSDVGDWKIIKCYEASLVGGLAPYDVATLHEQRQRIRTQINDIQTRLAELDNE